MQTPIEIFEKIAKDIPRCSKNANQMRDFIANYAKNHHYKVEIDAAGNVLCSKEGPRICLQAHYDMVCVGDTSNIITTIEDGWMRAQNSSLGADNGIGVAMMLSYMPHFENVEFLFTADEEIGLIGAKNLELKIASSKVLNLDSEEEGAIYVACAGGVENICKRWFELENGDGDFYEISIEGLPGGHSGLDIGKNIPNAIIELAKILKSKNAKIASFAGGEKRNSIPCAAKAVAALDDISGLEAFNLKKTTKTQTIKESELFLESLLECPIGVMDFNMELGVPEVSSNLAIVSLDNGVCEICVSSRAMSSRGLKNIAEEIAEHFGEFDYDSELKDFYEPWEWSEDDFCVFVKGVYKKYYLNSNFKAIHAGLECAALKKHFPAASFASVGPNIENPHSVNERVEIASVEKTYEAIFEILRQACA